MQIRKGQVQTALIDADIMLYRAAWKHEGGSLEEAKETIDAMFDHIFYVTHCTSYLGFLTGKSNFRKGIAVTKPYKGNRKDLILPELFHGIREYLVETWECVVTEFIEADDAMGICQTEMDKTIICSIDKDMLQIEGLHYNWNKNEVSFVDKISAERLFYKQVLMGDSTDNIVGVPKVGEKTADKILAKIENIIMTEAACIDVYHNHYKDYELSVTKMKETIDLVKIATSSSDSRFPEKFEVPEVSYAF
tara:strand:- start:61 stop:807 length:747 start_codon:yes stop_codon:yes gene_type:complete